MAVFDIAEIFLHFLSQVRLYHWQTYSFSRHKGSDELYTAMSGLIDQFIETYQGKYKRVLVSTKAYIPVFNLDDKKILDYLVDFKEFLLVDLEDHLDNMKNSDLFNIRDEMLSKINQTLYLFTLD